MAVKLTTTREAARTNGVKVCVYGMAGSGKTRLCASTGGSPIIISAEAGLLSLRDVNIPVIEVSSIDDVKDAYRMVSESAECKEFDWICLDSISEIAEVVLSSEKKNTKDPRQAYGALQETMYDLVRAFRDLPRNVYMSAKAERIKDDHTGSVLYGPSMPGQKLGQALPYFFDEVFALRVEKDSEGNMQRWLQTQPDFQWGAKDRSGALEVWEAPDLAAIAAKINRPND
jgi:phage nucleotide-binding protein